MDYLARESADLSVELWNRIDDTVIGTARKQLSCRRFLKVFGPLGPGATTVAVDGVGKEEVLEDGIGRIVGRTQLELPLLYEVRQLYPGESELGRQALDILKKRLKVSLPREEAAAIALHFVNYKAQADTAPDIDYGSLIEQATAIVERELNVTVDRDGFNYYRFVTHMHYMMKRTLDDTMIDSQNRELFESMKKEYPDIYSCAVKVAALIDQKLQKHLSEEEILYLILHINRLCAREDCDR